MILVATAISVALLPVMNAYSRFNERQADLYAWRSLGSVKAFCSAMEKLAAQNLSEREPSRMVEILFHSHPAIGRRMKAALAWEILTGNRRRKGRRPRLAERNARIQFQGELCISTQSPDRACRLRWRSGLRCGASPGWAIC